MCIRDSLPSAHLDPYLLFESYPSRVMNDDDKLVKTKGQLVNRKILPISLSYDHRIIDGAEGARFCVHLNKSLGKDFAFKLAV